MEQKHANYGLGMSVFGAIFFIFGFATTFIITLSAKVKMIFTLSEFEAQLLTAAFFLTYPVLSIPTGYLINRIGYKTAVVAGLIVMAIGSFLFFPAAAIPSFGLFLTATFVLAAGVVILQTAANPYVTALGPESSASGRLNLTQALNSIATMIAPWIISVAIFKGAGDMLDAATSAKTVQLPFIIMGVIITLVAIAIMAIKLPVLLDSEEMANPERVKKSVWKYPHVLLGALGIFFYVGAEVGNAGLLVNYLQSLEGLNITPEIASRFAAIYWGGAMIGRFFGSILLSEMKGNKLPYIFGVLILALVSGAFVTDWNFNYGAYFLLIAVINFAIMQLGKGNANRTLAVFAGVAAILAITTAVTTGSVSLWTIVSIGFFNSIMFPNIFALAVRDLDNAEKSTASGIINSLIFGGAVLPLIMGTIADSYGYTWAFFVPAFSYLYIFFYAVKGSKIR
ncbi:MFS transporter [Prolixibacter denitrificans]|uniref:FHS family L-fucose permease-like MFS transporter n=1 Tax=Prolixibacter denitrificans TaxID=1541063 RepID=A0A2P8CHL2_9BACT|nr:MFS transporter [Prolixibacter denitrificans]PSK84463.1 FHS family L-fucose permease-like MFS transporter [Prolixibacter denitrificans]GET20636.1 glucose/galactose MFS transporter [Prolixibacter denitrificans]